MKRTNLPDRFQDLIRRIPYVTIATVSPDGSPWNSPVVGRFDDEMNLYWVSWKENQHSQNIRNTARIFAVIYDSSMPEGTGEGLYIQMHAAELNTVGEVAAARKVYDTGFFEEPLNHIQFLDDDCPQRFYKAVPEQMWYNSGGQRRGHFVDLRHDV